MKKYEKEILQAQLDNEKEVLEALKESYNDALAQINGKLAQLLGRQDADLPHVIYQVQYQQMLKTQVQAILENLQVNEFQTVSEYLTASYNEGFIASQYAMQCQGVPLIFPIDQEKVVQAIQHETKLSSPLYTELGHDIKELSKTIAGEISRGISAGQGYGEIARNLSSYANIPLNNAMRIARTESHRIQCKSAMDAQYLAREKGADVLKEWNSYLDGKTRPHHRRLNGQIKELDEPFEVAGMKAMFPGDFGDPGEDCNCRCALLQRARWELDDEETQYLGDTSSMTEEQREEIAEKLGIPVDELDNYSESIVPLNATSLDDFRDKYNDIWHYEGSEEQAVNLAIAEQTRQSILSQRGRSNAQKINDEDASEVKVLQVAQGRNVIGQIDYANSEFEHDIETAMHFQGYDGLPQVVPYEEFAKAMQESNFYAERTYSASSKEELEEYRNMLYNGKWYVDCSTGGAQYGQGMYCAASYDLSDNKSIGGIGWEMTNYQEIGILSGRQYSYTEGITLQSDAKILTLYGNTSDISNRHAYEYALINSQSDEAKSTIQELINLDEQIGMATYNHAGVTAINDLRWQVREIRNSDIYQNEIKALMNEAYDNQGAKDAGVLAVEMGYDAINAIGHGESGSYTVVLNRTKVIFCEGGSIYGN